MRRFPFLLAIVASLAGQSAAAQTSTSPGGLPGVGVLERMRAAYAGRWYSTLTFIQKTTLHRPDGSRTEQTWWESVKHTPERGGRLRIDVDDLALGNGVIYTADSSWVVRRGKLVTTNARGNEFLPLIESVYLQPAERTARELAPSGVDLSKTRTDRWQGRPAWVVGASAAADTTSPQFWVDTERAVVVRMILRQAPTAPVLDVHIDGYVNAGGGMLGTEVLIHVNGKLAQEERYSEWKTDVPLSEALFDPAQWSTAPHWARVAMPTGTRVDTVRVR